MTTESATLFNEYEDVTKLTRAFTGMSLSPTTSISYGSGAQVGDEHLSASRAGDPQPVLIAPVEPGLCELGTKELGKPSTFKGEDDRWAEWAFVMTGSAAWAGPPL